MMNVKNQDAHLESSKLIPQNELVLPKTLYKYRSWKDEFHRKVLTHRQLFLSPPSWFEDPKDCKNPIRYDLLTDKERIQLIEHNLRESQPGKSRQVYRKMARDAYKNSGLRDDRVIMEQQEETFRLFDERLGVLCLTENFSSLEMWRKYSDNHNGYCVGFHPEKLSDFVGGGGNVEYVPELPTIYPYPMDSRNTQIIKQLFYKEDKWKFEEEYRNFRFTPNPMKMGDRIIILPHEAFKEIILGEKVSEKKKQEIIDVLPDELQNISIRQTKLVNGLIVAQ